MARKKTIGSAAVELMVEDSTFRADMAKNEAQFSGSMKRMAAETKHVDDSFTRMGKSIESQTAGVRKLSGAISSTAGVVTSMLGVWSLIAAAVTGIVLAVRELAKESTAAAEEAEKNRKTWEAVAATIAEARAESSKLRFGEGSTESLKAQLDLLKAQQASAIEGNSARQQLLDKIAESEERLAALGGVVAQARRAIGDGARIDFEISGLQETILEARKGVFAIDQAIKESFDQRGKQLREEFARAEAEAARAAESERSGIIREGIAAANALRREGLTEEQKLREDTQAKVDALEVARMAAILNGRTEEAAILKSAIEDAIRLEQEARQKLEDEAHRQRMEAIERENRARMDAIERETAERIRAEERVAQARRAAERGLTTGDVGFAGSALDRKLDTLIRVTKTSTVMY